MSAESFWMLALLLAIPLTVAGLGSRIGERGDAGEAWYASLRKAGGRRARVPGWMQERLRARILEVLWAFAWICAGVASWSFWLEWRQGGTATPMFLYGLSLLGAAGWQGVSIGLRQLGLGLGWGLAVWGTVTLTAIDGRFAPYWPWVWLAPYWLMTGYGALFNYQLWRLNRSGIAPPPEQVS